MKYFSNAVALLVITAPIVISHEHASKPKQGVFVLSNQIENEVGVYESLDDGALSWSVAPLEGIFTCSVAAYQDRVCAVTCAGSVTMECFRISESDEDATLMPEFLHDFEATLPPVDDQPNAVSAAYGPGNILFSNDGKQVGIIMKGDAGLEGNSTLFAPPKAGLHVFSLEEDVNGYGDPAFLPLPDASLPFAFTWRSGELETTNQIAVIVNIAGENLDYPACGATDTCRSSVSTVLSQHDEEGKIVLSKVDEINADQVDLCWLDYRFGHWYTGNFFSDSVTIGTVSREGILSLERNAPIGRGTIPSNVAHMGRNIDGSFFLYTENQGTAEVCVHRVIENEPSFQLEVMVGAPYADGITGDAWQGAHGIATTLFSEEELFAMYDYGMVAKDDSAKGTGMKMANKDETNEEESSSAASADTIVWGAAASLAVLML